MSDATVAAAASVAAAVITAVVGPVVLARFKRVPPRRPALARGGRPLVPAPTPALHIMLRESGPRAVMERLAAVPPLRRAAVARELFVGRWVEWEGVVRDVRERDGGFRVEVVGTDGGAALVDFADDERPALETLREGDAIRYAGRVTGAEDGRVTVDATAVVGTGA